MRVKFCPMGRWPPPNMAANPTAHPHTPPLWFRMLTQLFPVFFTPTTGWQPAIAQGFEKRHIREDICKKSQITFGHCPKEGGGLHMPEFFGSFLIK